MTKRRLPPLTALRAFEAFARSGRMTTAADELCVTHGAVSRQVRLLEEACGFALTEGPRNNLRLTEAGARLADSLTQAFDGVERRLADLRTVSEAELHVSCVGTFAMRWLIPRLADFQARWPKVRVKVTESYDAVDFAHQPYDTAIRIAEQAPAHWGDALPFLENYHGPVAAPGLAGETDPQQLLSRPRLHTGTRTEAWAEWSAHAGVDLPDSAEHHQFEHIFYTLEAAAAGLGVGLSPWVYVARDLDEGRLCAPLGFVRTPARFWLVLPRSGAKPSVFAFKDWLTEQAAKVSPPA